MLHDRVLSNRASRRHFARDDAALDGVQARIVEDLSREGYSLLTVSDVFGDDGWGAIERQAASFIADTEAGLAGSGEHLKVREGKEFVVRLHSYGAEVSADDAWFSACASRKMLDVANAYLGLWSKLEYVDMWYSVPQPENADRISSQRWHRDFNDRKLVKVFLYLVDVDEGTGPFQYIAGSAPGGTNADAWPWRPLGENYPPEAELEQQIAADAVRTFTGPKGTLLFCNTAGFHRGGFATTSARVLATATYSSPASLAALTERSYHCDESVIASDDAVRFALT